MHKLPDQLRPPEDLEGAALLEWHRMVEESANPLTAEDRPVLMLYCSAYAIWSRAMAEASANPVAVLNAQGAVAATAEIGVANAQAKIMLQCLDKMQRSPLGRAKRGQVPLDFVSADDDDQY